MKRLHCNCGKSFRCADCLDRAQAGCMCGEPRYARIHVQHILIVRVLLAVWRFVTGPGSGPYE